MLKFKINVDWSKCRATSTCVKICPTFVFKLKKIKINNEKKLVSYVINEDLCIGCMGCVVLCPNKAITVEPKSRIQIIKQTRLF